MDWSLYERELRHEKVKLNGDREKSFSLGGGGGGAQVFGQVVSKQRCL